MPPATPPRPHTPSRSRETLVNYGLPTLVALLIVGGTAWFVFRHMPLTRQETIASIAANLDQRMETRRLAIETWLDKAFQDAAAVASFPTVRAELRTTYAGGRRRNAHLDGILASTAAAERIEAMLVLDTALRTVSSTQPRLEPAAFTVVRAVLTTRRPAADFVRYAGGMVRIVIAMPVIEDSARGPIGVAVLVVSPTEWLFPFLAAPPVVEPSGEALLVRRDGDSVQVLSPLRLRAAPPMTLRWPASAPNLAAVVALAGTGGFGEYRDYRNVPVFASITPITGAPWALVVKVDQHDALRAWRQRMWATAITQEGLLLLAALLVAVFWWGTRKALQASEARTHAHLATLLDQASDAILFVDLDGRIRNANRRAHEFYGYPGAGLIGKPVFALRPEALRDEGRARFQQMLARGEIVIRAIHLAAGGREVPVEVNARRVRMADDDVIVMIVRDITERQEAEVRILRLNRMLRTLSEINQLMVHGQSAEQIMREACRIAVEHGGFQLAWIAVPEPGGGVRSVAAAGATGYLEGIQVRWDDSPQGRGPTGTSLREDRTVTLADMQTDPAFAPWRERALAHGLRSSAACPIRKGGAVAGVLMLYADTPAFFDAESTALLEELAGDLGFALRSLEERAALRETEAKLNAFFHSPAIGMLFGDIHGRIFDANDELLRIVGYDREDIASGRLRWDAITPPEFLPLDAERVAEAVRKGVCTPYEKQYIRKDGVRAWVLVGYALLGDPRELSVAYVLDISAKKRAENALQESEQRFRQVVEGAPVGILIHSGGRIRYLNEAACALFGVTDYAALIGTQVQDRVHPDDRAAVVERVTALLERRLPAPPREERLLRMNGGVFFAEVEAVPTSHDAAPGVMVFFRDVTAQKRAQDEQALVSAALEQSAEVAVITDADGTIIYVNPAFERVTGYSRAEAVGRNPRILKSGDQNAAFYLRMWQDLTAGQVFTSTVVNRRKDGSHYFAELVISPIRDAAGQVTRYLALQRDVTHEHELEDQLRQAQKMDAVGRLTGGIAHDFNNLLSVVLANAAVLRRDLPPERTDLFDYVDDLMESATHGAAVVRKLLAFSRRERLSPTALDLGRALDDVGRTLQRFLPETIRVTIRAEWTLTATVDAAALDQIMLNLATNARDAMPEGGTLTIRMGEVELESADAAAADLQPGHYVWVDVTDTGHGMDEETMVHVYEPFFTTKPVGSGTGLGLAMVFGLMRQLGGSVRITSAPGAGTTVRLYFRAARRTPFPAPQAVATAEPASAPEGGTILIVEDQERLRRATARALNRLGYQVIVSADGNEALRVLAGHAGAIDLVLSDVVMPGLSGVALYRRLRAEGQVVPFLLMSGYAPGTGEGEGVPDDIPIIMKPWTLEALGERIHQLIADGPGH